MTSALVSYFTLSNLGWMRQKMAMVYLLHTVLGGIIGEKEDKTSRLVLNYRDT